MKRSRREPRRPLPASGAAPGPSARLDMPSWLDSRLPGREPGSRLEGETDVESAAAQWCSGPISRFRTRGGCRTGRIPRDGETKPRAERGGSPRWGDRAPHRERRVLGGEPRENSAKRKVYERKDWRPQRQRPRTRPKAPRRGAGGPVRTTRSSSYGLKALLAHALRRGRTATRRGKGGLRGADGLPAAPRPEP